MIVKIALSTFLLLGAAGFGCVSWMMAGERLWAGAVITFGLSALCLVGGICNLVFESGPKVDPWDLTVRGLGERVWILSKKQNPVCYDVVLLTENAVKVRKRTGWLEPSIASRLNEAHGDIDAVMRDKWTKEIHYDLIDRLELDSLNESTTICYRARRKRRYRLSTAYNQGMFLALGAALGDGCRTESREMRAIDAARIPMYWLMITLLSGGVLYHFSTMKRLTSLSIGRSRARNEIIHWVARTLPSPAWLGLTVVASAVMLIWLIDCLRRRPRIQVISAKS